jgi:endonuclease/exonuclease/phosphatase family metal-dependent hydrolase
MRKFIMLVVVAALGGGGYQFSQKFRIEGLDSLHVVPRDGSAESNYGQVSLPQVQRTAGSIRIASFNIQVFGEKKLSNPRVRGLLAEIVRQFDVIAVQEIRSKQDILPQFVDVLNSSGRHYDFVIGPRLGRTASKEQYAFIFDTASIEIDRNSLYTVADPDDRLHREPLVGWFRVRGPSPEQAFTFSLVDIHTDPDETRSELDALAAVFRAVRDDGRGEDDVIILGDLNVDDHHLGMLGQLPQVHWAISGVATNTRGDKLYDNLVFSSAATSEYTGRWGVFDMIRQFNLTVDEALEVSDHMPVWAEFNLIEGGQGGRVATRPFNAHGRGVGMQLSKTIEDALQFAAALLATQERKGSGVPYVAHLLGVTSLVLEYGGDEEQAIAALLHDAVEDQGGQPTLDEIRRRYGQRVATIVEACTDADVIPKPPWQERKEKYLAHLATADSSARLVAAADKLYNLRTIVADYRAEGDAIWPRFTTGKPGTTWYYRAVLDVLAKGERSPIIDELARTVEQFEQLVGKPRS